MLLDFLTSENATVIFPKFILKDGIWPRNGPVYVSSETESNIQSLLDIKKSLQLLLPVYFAQYFAPAYLLGYSLSDIGHIIRYSGICCLHY
jgi:hypothetical protein